MKIERINDNQIRCTLNSLDLSSRNINLLELAYGTEKARRLFREMLQKASCEVGFDVDNIPLMIEAIPLSGDSIMLVITKIEDPDELDTRFAKFSPFNDENASSLLSQLAGDFLEKTGEALNCLEDGSTPTEPAQQTENPAWLVRIFCFDGLDRANTAAGAVNTLWEGESALYKKPGSHQYYLVLRHKGTCTPEFSRVCNILAEYAPKLNGELANEAYYKEHYDTIIAADALKKLCLF